ncbi:hypothetical protein J31TS4_11630 [Paenibacillus sp. J31TS4]|uniref:hypothetical protein n=1 Tax=Paenibacillus sp. J31TS4 TaxID=2807195 RepID=UPI001B252027|nr:hypothetical protein [Paenibacillus sp. J31TS4]GIP37883.1 hypothetical protein J31TS4_11630 [Paenibacillus sp. J31TS4]
MKELTKEEVQQMISLGKPITNSSIQNLDLYNKMLFEGEEVRTPVIFESCFLSNVDFAILQFYEEVVFQRCKVISAGFHGAYFYKGIVIEDCEFHDTLYFDCGGHNESPHLVKINQTDFYGYVDFFDSWFMGPVEIINCTFHAGTNLLCDMNDFEFPPLLVNNSGNLHLENERGY